MRILSWLKSFTPSLWSSTSKLPLPARAQIEQQVLSYSRYPELQIIKEAGATNDQLKACQRGFVVLEQSGLTAEIKPIAESCIEIIQTPSVTLEHIVLFFGLITAHKLCIPISRDEIDGIAKDITNGIKHGFSAKKIAQDILSIYSS